MKYKLNQVCYQNRYSQLDAESIMELASHSTDVKLLPSSKNYDLFTSFDEAGDLACKGEVITLGKARYANIKYWCGNFISSNNNIIESKNTNFLRSKYLYYFLSYTSKDYYVEATTYPKFDQKNFDNHTIDIPNVDTQDSRLIILDSLVDLIQKERLQLDQLEELTKSRFIELFGDVDSNTNGYPSYKIGSQFSLGAGGTPSTQNKEYWDNGTISWIGSNMCQNVVLYENDGKFITEKGYANSSAKLFKPDTVLIALVGATIGKVALLKFETTTNQNVLGMWDIKKNGYDPYYVYYYMQAIYGKFTAIGDGNFKMASKAFVSNLDILKPSLALQTEFSMFVEKIDKLKFNVQQRIEKYKELLNKKMSEYFN